MRARDSFHGWLAALDDPFANACLERLPNLNMLDGPFEPESGRSSIMRSLALAAVPRYESAQGQALDSLERVVKGVDPLPLLTGIMLVTNVRPWGEYFEPGEQPLALALELVAGIIASLSPAERRIATADDLMNVVNAAVELQFSASSLSLAYYFSCGDDREEIANASLRDELLTRWLTLRGAAYPMHAESAAKALSENHERNLEKKTGFSIGDLMDLISEHRNLWENSLSSTLDLAWECASSSTGENPNSLREGSSHFQGIWYKSAMYLLAEALSVPVAGDARLLGSDRVDRERAIFRMLSMRQGDAPAVNSVLFDPPQRSHPFLILPSPLRLDGSEEGKDIELERALLVDYYALSTDLHMTIESILNKSFPRWSTARARAVDEHAVSLVQRVLPGSQVVTNVYIDGPDGREEVDGVVIFEDVAMVVEGKGAPLKLAARRGSVDKLVSQLRELVGGGWQQLQRDRDYLMRRSGAKFYDQSGRCVLKIDRTIRRCYQLLPSIDGLGDVGTTLPRLVDLGVLPENARPWIVGITDLNVVVDILCRPVEFVGYMEFRERWVIERRLKVIDELEMLNLYLYQVDLGARLQRVGSNGLVAHAPNQALLDNWYEGNSGLGPVVDRPRIRMTKRIRRFVDELQRIKPSGWLASATAALQVPITVAEGLDLVEAQLAARAQRVGTHVTGDGIYTFIVIGSRNDWGQTIQQEQVQHAITNSSVSLLLQCHGNRLRLRDVRLGSI
jgi:hypothetical protein